MIQSKMAFAIDWEKFGWSVWACSYAAGSYRKLVDLHDGMTVSMVSRAVNASDAHPVSAASFLHLCACLDLDVWQFYLRKKTREPRFKKVRSFKDIVRNQAVSASVSREAFPKRSLTASRSLPRKGADARSRFEERLQKADWPSASTRGSEALPSEADK